MYKQTVTYTDFDDEVVTETFLFNLTSAEVTDLLATDNSFYSDFAALQSKYRDVKTIAKFVKALILSAYGVRTESGGFRKNAEYRETFAASEAYSTIYMDLLQNPDKLMSFFKAVIPSEYRERMSKLESRPDLLEKFQKGQEITAEDLEGSGLSVVKDSNSSKG